MIRIKRTFVSLLVLLLFGGAIVFLISSLMQPKYTYFKPTSEFYINDKADKLSQGAKWGVYLNSEMLYEDSLDTEYPEEIRGSQVVVVTYQTDKPFSSTTLFNEMKIGKNNMGILIVLLFDAEGNFDQIIYEIGLTMMGYITAIDAGNLISDHFFAYEDIDLGLGELYFETLTLVYDRVYDVNFSYDMEEYEEDVYNFFRPLPSEDFFDTGWYSLFLIGGLPSWLSITLLIILGLGATGTLGFLGLSANSGGGGRSIGYWLGKKK